MERILILFNKNDEETSDRIENVLHENGLIWTFLKQFEENLPLEHQIFEALKDADYVVCIFSKKYLQSNVRIENLSELQNYKNRIIPIYFKNYEIQNRPIVDFDKGVEIEDHDDSSLQKLIRILSEKSSPLENYAKIQQIATNPFGRLRAEFFDLSLFTNTFFAPEKEKYDKLTSPRTIILEGGRGSGKTMILKSLEANTAIQMTGKDTFENADLAYFGVYMHLNRGGFVLASESEIKSFEQQIARQLFLDDFVLQFTQSLTSTIVECVKTKKLTISENDEKTICNKITHILKLEQKIDRFDNLLIFIDNEKRDIRKFVGLQALNRNVEYTGCYTAPETFKEICKIVLEYGIKVPNTTIFLLLDEYENLLESQQIIINTMIKNSDNVVSLKVASKFEGIYTRKTLYGEQDIQNPHDYSGIKLDYDLRNDDVRIHYERLVKGATANLLKASSFKEIDITKLLKDGPELRITKEDLKQQLDKMLNAKNKDTTKLSESEINQKISYVKNTLIFRALYDKQLRREKTYAGFDTYILLSSGIIRQFLELCGMAYYLAQQEGFDVSTMAEIPIEIQTKAVHNVSAALLEKIAPGVEDLGIIIQRFIIDIGDIFRNRLLYDNNEPETIRIGINEPKVSWSQRLKDVYHIGIRESVFQNIEEFDAMRPKQSTYARPIEFILNRIFCPVLEIGHLTRWRTNFSADDLTNLLDSKQRSDIMKKLTAEAKKSSQKKSHKDMSLDRFGENG